jgi:hypothetical protein
MGLPQLGEHQVGATYYYSPLTINCFGIADVYLEQPKLSAYIYHEGEGKKGGNNVASLIMKHIIDRDWHKERGGRGELNIIMDNCAGQNKNKMVLRLAPFLVELGWYQKVNMIFLVAGHTKNAADWLFNLLKKEYQKSNIYNMQQLVNKLNDHRLIHAVKVGAEDFYDFNSYFDSIYTQIPSGAIKQYQYFKAYFMKSGWFQAQSSSPLLSEGVIFDLRPPKKDEQQRKSIIKNFDIKHIKNLEPPGVRPIKQVEMYEKWRRFVPAEHITDLYAKPTKETAKKVLDDQKKNRIEAAEKKKAAAATRTKTTIIPASTTKKSPTPRKKLPAAPKKPPAAPKKAPRSSKRAAAATTTAKPAAKRKRSS